jgi:hypothetical protein
MKSHARSLVETGCPVPRLSRRTALALALAAVVGAPAPALGATEAPVKEIGERTFGWEVNKNTSGVCLVLAEECQPGRESGKPGGFSFPEGVAVGPSSEHYVYVADKVNRRMQVFTPAGAFVSMFGREVDKTTKANVCPASSGDECQPGQPAPGGPAGAIDQPTSVAVDQSTGDLYVLDYSQNRIEKYTAAGEFLLMVGGEVNKKDRTSTLCTKAEQGECESGVASAPGATTPCWFKPEDFRGDLLAVGSDGVLRVGDEGRVQQIDQTGKCLPTIQVPGIVGALAVNAAGELFLTEEGVGKAIHRIAKNGEEVKDAHWPLALSAKKPEAEAFGVNAIAIDPGGRLAVSFFELERTHVSTYGFLLNTATGETISSFGLEVAAGISSPSNGIAFSTAEVEVAKGVRGYPMYAAAQKQEAIAYLPSAIGELSLKSRECQESGREGTDVLLTCRLLGEVNPWEVPQTKIWFEWGRTAALGNRTPAQVVCANPCGGAAVPVSAPVEGLRPNESGFHFRMAGEDANVEPPELLESHNPEQETLTTSIVPPVVIGLPEASFVYASSAVMFGELNPENARTEYFFEYAPGDETLAEQCPGGVRHVEEPGQCSRVATTSTREAPCQQVKGLEECAYGPIGTTIEATGLQASTVYHYRLFAEDESIAGDEPDKHSVGEEGTFTTGPALTPTAETGGYAEVTATSARISGSINPDGQPATYTFELGVYEGSATRYGVVSSGLVVASRSPVAESLSLTGLQSATTYAYRMVVDSGYGHATGATATFTTQGLPPALTLPPPSRFLPVPPYEFEKPPPCRHRYKRDRHGKCVKARTRRLAKRHRVRKRRRKR